MGILGFAFMNAAVGTLSDMGQSQENVIESAVSHVSNLGNTAPRGRGFGLG